MRKIHITSLHLKHGGIEMAISSLANALVKRGYEVEILCTYHLGEPVYALDDRVTVTYLTDVRPNKEAVLDALKRKDLPGLLKEGLYSVKVLYLKKKVLRERFRAIKDGVILSTRNEDSVLLSKYGNKKVLKIAQLHHDHRFDKRLLRDFKNHYKNIDVFLLLTDELTREVSKMMAANKHTTCLTMPNFLPDSTQVTTTTERKNQVVSVGRLHEVKGFLRLIDMWAAVAEKSDTVLKIIGSGEQESELKNRIRELGLENRVILTGAMDHPDVLREMQKSLFYVMTSFTEGFPFVLIEAMSQGLPAVAFDVRVGPRAIIEHEKNGFLIEDNNRDEFVNRVLYLIENATVREDMSKSAYLRAEDFTESNILEKWNDILNTGK
ncbi:MAG: glycosyltransferase [Clostridia bacterium]|nr:glycosyltransferase [Clostridia bacterium]